MECGGWRVCEVGGALEGEDDGRIVIWLQAREKEELKIDLIACWMAGWMYGCA